MIDLNKYYPAGINVLEMVQKSFFYAYVQKDNGSGHQASFTVES